MSNPNHFTRARKRCLADKGDEAEPLAQVASRDSPDVGVFALAKEIPELLTSRK